MLIKKVVAALALCGLAGVALGESANRTLEQALAQKNVLNGADGKQLEAQVSELPLGKTGASAEVRISVLLG